MVRAAAVEQQGKVRQMQPRCSEISVQVRSAPPLPRCSPAANKYEKSYLALLETFTRWFRLRRHNDEHPELGAEL